MTRQLNDLKQQIERILHWEPSSHWRTLDFSQLVHLIYQHTQVRVEAHELEAFWQSANPPSRLLLDTLAQFADYVDWDDFCTRNFYGTVDFDSETEALHAPMWEIPMPWVVAICWFSVVAAIAVGVLLIWKR